MNRLAVGWIGGLAGAVVVTALHECIRHCYSGATRLDELGKEATQKVIDAAGGNKLPERQLYWTSMVGDIISNATYYSAAASKGKHAVASGTALGLLAGIGAVKLPGKIGLTASATNATLSRRLITMGLYTLGGLVSGIVIRRAVN